MDDIAEVRVREEQLRAAMLAGDVPALSNLMDDRLIFTAPDGSVMDKAGDLAAHETGLLKLTTIDIADTAFHRVDGVIATTTKAALSGTFDGAAFNGAFAYTRIWSRSSGEWRIIAGHASAIS